jgi:hypothetical protein
VPVSIFNLKRSNAFREASVHFSSEYICADKRRAALVQTTCFNAVIFFILGQPSVACVCEYKRRQLIVMSTKHKKFRFALTKTPNPV